MSLGELGDVHQPFNALLDAYKSTKWHELGDSAWDNLTDLVGAGKVLPRVFLGCLERQRHSLAVHDDIKNLDRDLHAHLDNL